jgi:hypothetical protein
MPGGVTPVVVLDDHSRVVDDLSSEEQVLVVVVHHDQLAGVEQPVVVPRQVGGLRDVPGEVADVLASLVGMLGYLNTHSLVVGQWHADHPHTSEHTPSRRPPPDPAEPVLEPCEVILLVSDELAERFVLVRLVVLVASLQAERRVFERVEECLEVRIRKVVSQRSPPSSW